MKKPVLIGASLVLATSILGACGKESSTANAENQKITQSQVADITLNGEHLSTNKIKQYKDEYMQVGKFVEMNTDTQAVIKNMVLKDGMMKDLDLTQENFNRKYEKAVKDGYPKTKLNGKEVVVKSVVLETTLEEAYAKKYLSNRKIVNSIIEKVTEKEDKKIIEIHQYAKKDSSSMGGNDYILLFYLAQKYDVVDTLKYQQNLLDKADIKGVELTKLKTNEVIF